MMHTLEGILTGISIDQKINEKEIKALKAWLEDNKELSNKRLFIEAYNLIEEVLEDGVIDEEEKQDILWFCQKFTTENTYYSEITSDLQRLHGLLGGIVADGVITKEELEGLDEWMSDNFHLKGCWPFDELETLILKVLEDGIIDEEEHNLLKTFFAEFLKTKDHKKLSFPLNEVEKDIMALCAVCPTINFENSVFCFTGKFKDISRKKLEDIVVKCGGRVANGVSKDINYLVIGSDGNPSWAFSCYGRKVEKAIDLRKQRINITIAHEFDFWDAVQDLNIN